METGLDRFFEQAVDDKAADVPWSRVAALLAIHRLCAPGSELAIEQRWYPSTALDDLLGIEDGKINDACLYRCLDRILPHKTKLANVPSADFCCEIKAPRGAFSRDSATHSKSPEANLQPMPLMDMGFAIVGPSRGDVCLQIRCLYIGSYVCSTLPLNPAHDDAFALRYYFTSMRLWRGLSPPELSNMLGIPKKGLQRDRCRPLRFRWT